MGFVGSNGFSQVLNGFNRFLSVSIDLYGFFNLYESGCLLECFRSFYGVLLVPKIFVFWTLVHRKSLSKRNSSSTARFVETARPKKKSAFNSSSRIGIRFFASKKHNFRTRSNEKNCPLCGTGNGRLRTSSRRPTSRN